MISLSTNINNSNQSAISKQFTNSNENQIFNNMTIIIAILLGLIDFITFGGNLLVVIAVASTKSLHTITNSFILSLAVADLLVSILVMPISIYSIVTDHEWKFGQIVCDLYISSDIMLCTASILNLCCISLDRYFAITRPLSYCRKRSTNLARKMIALVWIGSILITCPPVFGWSDMNRNLNSCGLNTLLSYRIFSSMGSFFLPCIVMIFVYLRIFKVIHDREKYLMSSSANCIKFSNSLNKNHHDHKEKIRNNYDENDLNNFKSGQDKFKRFKNSFKLDKNKINNNNFSLSSNGTNSSIYIKNASHKFNNSSINSNNTMITLATENETNFKNKKLSKKPNSFQRTKSKSKSFNDFSFVRNASNKNNNNNVVYELNCKIINDKEINLDTKSVELGKNNQVTKSNKFCFKEFESKPHARVTNEDSQQISNKFEVLGKNYFNSSPKKFNSSFEKISSLNSNNVKKSTSLASFKQKQKKFLKHSSSNSEQQLGLIKESKAAKTLAVLVGSFILAWGPFFIMYILEVLFPNLISIGWADFITWIGYLNSTFNPIIYAWYSKQFRDAFYRLTIDKIRVRSKK